MNTDTLKLIFSYANKFDIECDYDNNESSIAAHLARLSFIQHKKAIAYNKELRYFAQVIDALRKAFGYDQVSVFYRGNPYTLINSGCAYISIKDILEFDLITDSEEANQATNFLDDPIHIYGNIIDEYTYDYSREEWYGNMSGRQYSSAEELVMAIQDMPLWEKRINERY